MNSSEIKSLILIIASASSVIITLAGFNLLIDPYNLFGAPHINGFNSVKSVIASKQRVYQTVELLDRCPEVLILGTSRSNIGINPSNPIFGTPNVFNAAMSGQQIWESKKLLERLLKTNCPKPKTVILGLDFFAFNMLLETPFDYSDENFNRFRRFELVFSLTTVLDSLRTLIRQNYSEQILRGGLLRSDGFREYVGNPSIDARSRFIGSERGYLQDIYRPLPHCKWNPFAIKDGLDAYGHYSQLILLAKENNIRLVLFISPSHARQWETIAASNLWENFESWKNSLVKISADLSLTLSIPEEPIWDFAGYSDVSSIALPAKGIIDVENYWDSSHYKEEIGALMLNRIFNHRLENSTVSDLSNFGFPMRINNIEKHLLSINVQRQHYEKINFSEVIEIREIAKAIESKKKCQ
jgi:hypothetical protein